MDGWVTAVRTSFPSGGVGGVVSFRVFFRWWNSRNPVWMDRSVGADKLYLLDLSCPGLCGVLDSEALCCISVVP